jgi:hypothetical protein
MSSTGNTWHSALLQWSQTAYGLIHAVDLAERLDFGNTEMIGNSIHEAFNWLPRSDQFQSNVDHHQSSPNDFQMNSVDAIACLEGLKRNLLGLLIVDLATIADGILADILESRSLHCCDYPYLREKTKAVRCDPTQRWSQKGVLELNVIRNCFVHNQGKWSEKGLRDIADIVGSLTAKEGDMITTNFEDVFRYKRAVRTLINQADSNGFD